MRILISAAEASSDAHGAQLLKALRETAPAGERIEAFGVGGPKLQAAGLRVMVDARDLLAMGVFAVLARLPKILRGLRLLVLSAQTERPDLVVVLDYPDFHFKFAKRIQPLGIPLVYYIPPKVWVWRQKRVQFLKQHFQKLLCILPFEKAFYRERGVEAQFVGNPILDELPVEMNRSEARRRLGLRADERVVVLMPGSRPAELAAHFTLMLSAGEAVAKRLGTPLQALVPLPITAELQEGQKYIDEWLGARSADSVLLKVRLTRGNAHECLIAADVGIIKSGTSTLEAGLLGCPHVIVYRGSRLIMFLFQLFVGYKGPVGLVNLAILDSAPGPVDRLKQPFREVIMNDLTSERLQQELWELLEDPQRKLESDRAIQKLRERVLGGRSMQAFSPSRQAAQEIWALYQKQKNEVREPQRVAPFFMSALSNRLLSFVWSAINRVYPLFSALFRKPFRAPARVISVGNLQVGGSGKTPLVAQIAKESIERGLTVCILTRGYQGRWESQGGLIAPGAQELSVEETGDEALLLHDRVPGAWIGVGANRVQSYQTVVKSLQRDPDIVILDDGFQNRQFVKDVEVVTLTSAKPGEKLFREFFSSLHRAHLVVWTKGQSLPVRLPLQSGVPLARIKYCLAGAQSRPILLVTGVADSDSVRQSAEQAGYQVVQHSAFPDHARYAEPIIHHFLEQAAKAKISIALTGKDWVKWRHLVPENRKESIVVLEPEIEFIEGKTAWSKTLWGS